MPCFFKFSNCCIITAQTTYFESTQYSKIYFHYDFVSGKTTYKDFTFFFGIYFHFKFRFFNNVHYLQISKCLIITAQRLLCLKTTNIAKYSYYGFVSSKISYLDFTSVFWKIFPLEI